MISPQGPDFSLLAGSEQYVRYFAQVSQACTLLTQSYAELGSRDGASREARIEADAVVSSLHRFLASLTALKMRYTYRDEVRDRPLYIDLTDSGFPNYHEINMLEIDSRDAASRLRDNPGSMVLKRKLIDALIHTGEDQPALLAELSERTYWKLIEHRERLLLTFAPAEIHCRGEVGDVRQYVATWNFYDSTDNVPSLYILSLDQKMYDDPLETMGSNSHQAFQEVVRREGQRAGNLMVMAVEFDKGLQHIHPKFLKRMRMGPLYSKLLLEARDVATLSEKELRIYELLSLCPGGDEVILFGKDDILFSLRQEKLESTLLRSLGFRKDVREIFYIPESNLEAYEHGISHGHQYAVVPHRVLQHVTPEIVALVPELGPHVRKIVYNEKGDVHVI